MSGDDRSAAFEGALRVSRDATIDGLLALLRAHPSDRIAESPAGLRRRAQGIVLGIESQLRNAVEIPTFAEELGGTLFGISDGSDKALIAILAYLDRRFDEQIPASLREEMRPKLLAVCHRMMRGWVERAGAQPEAMQELAAAVRERVHAGDDGDVVRAAVEQATAGMMVMELASGTPIVFNRALEDLFGFTVEEEMALAPEQVQNEDSADDDYDLLADMVEGRIPSVERISARPHKDGRSVPFRLLSWPVRDGEGAITHLASIITEAEPHSSETFGSGLAEKRARYLLQLSPDPVIVAGEDGAIRYASPSVESTFGVDPDHLISQHIVSLVTDGSRAAGRELYRRALSSPRSRIVAELEASLPDGSLRWFEVVATNLLDVDDVQGIVFQGRDITERRDLLTALEQMARTESLTGLLNRRGFLEELERRLARRSASDGKSPAVAMLIYVDLDDFKAVNDRYGHFAGDAVLMAIARRLETLVDGHGIAGRMGGDEFVLFVEYGDPAALRAFRERLAAALHGTVTVDGADIAYAGSFGMVELAPGTDAMVLLRAADGDLARAKRLRMSLER